MSHEPRGQSARRHPEQRIERPSAQPAPFESLVERALDSLPKEFQRLLADVAIVIEEAPSPDQSGYADTPGDDWLYGVYEGVPATEWGADMVPFPNKITLFQRPLETDFPDPVDLEEQVRITVLHELAHHAGIDDDRLIELDYG
jgi:predicted Zn-dependent protease with MMP-like domain